MQHGKKASNASLELSVNWPKPEKGLEKLIFKHCCARMLMWIHSFCCNSYLRMSTSLVMRFTN